MSLVPKLCSTTADTHAILHKDGLNPYHIWFSPDPFHKCVIIPIPIKGTHPTLGLITMPTPLSNHRIQLIDMAKSTPAHKIPRWRSTLKRAVIIAVDDNPVAHEEDIKKYISMARQKQADTIMVKFATPQPQPLHPTEGSLMLYYDQMNIIANHLKQAYPHKHHTYTM